MVLVEFSDVYFRRLFLRRLYQMHGSMMQGRRVTSVTKSGAMGCKGWQRNMP